MKRNLRRKRPGLAFAALCLIAAFAALCLIAGLSAMVYVISECGLMGAILLGDGALPAALLGMCQG